MGDFTADGAAAQAEKNPGEGVRNGGDLVVETLEALGATTVFGIPGQHALAPRTQPFERDLAGHHYHGHSGGVGFLQPSQ